MSYSNTLAVWLEPEHRTQSALADRIGKTQVAVSRYATGERFPNSETARAIDDATAGAVPFELWQREASSRFLGEAAGPLTCGVCDKRADNPEVRLCVASNCGLRPQEQEAA